MSTSHGPCAARPRRQPRGGAFSAIATTLLLLAASSLPAHAQVVVGTVSEVRVWAFGREAGARRWDDLFAHQAMRQGQGVKTVPKGAARLRFIDNTELRLGSDAEVTLDKYLYSAPQALEGMSVNFGKGVMRVITGHMSKPAIRIETPTAVIGVRGTDFVTYVLANLTTLVYVLSGTVVVTPKAGGPATALTAGESGAVAQGATQVDTADVRPYREDPNLSEPGPEGWDGLAGPGSGEDDSSSGP
jgi:hypothetical protein